MDGGGKRRPDRERTRQEILDAALQEFAENGLNGARVDAISARINSAKQMIYYYFGSKEGLYFAVLEKAYADIREAERALDLTSLDPVEAITRLITFTFDYQEAHPEFIRLVCTENIHNGRHIVQSARIKKVNRVVIQMISDILDRGKHKGLFRPDADPVDVHMLISALCFFRVSNRHTFGFLFGRDLAKSKLRKVHKKLITDVVLCSLKAPGGEPGDH
jgi:AcrR family transcriptional regulator